MFLGNVPVATNACRQFVGAVIGENACIRYFDSIHGRGKRWGLRSNLGPLTHVAVACITPSG